MSQDRQEVARQVAELAAVYANRRAYLADTARFKAAGHRGVIGYFCTYAPEELILAAGYHPARIVAEPGMVGPVDGHLQSFACSFARGCLDQALRGHYEGLDGVVFPATCDSLRHAAEIWKRNVPQRFFHFMNFPSRLDAPGAADYAAHELADLAEALGGFAGIGGAAVLAKLPETSALMAEIRALLGRLWEDRLTWPRPPLTGAEALSVFLAGVVMERREYRDRLARLVTAVEALGPGAAGAGAAASPGAAGAGGEPTRLVVTGGVIEDPATIRLVEESGAVVVGDDLCTGTRAFATSGGAASGGAAAGGAGSPTDLAGLARLYLAKVPCPTKHPIDRRVDSLLGTARRGRAAGVVFLLQKFCETHAFDQPYLTSRLTEIGLPSLVLEVEQGRLTEGQAGTRLGAFLEMIAGRREVAAANGGEPR
ncbi:MAG: 2-hydroxyacyl-CoA dehydratase subunit D [Bacillota bacterium]